VSGSLRPRTIKSFLEGIQISFQRLAAGDLNATYHFTFTGSEAATATVVIRDGKIKVSAGLQGEPHLRVTADTATWLGFLAKEKSLPWALLTRRIKLRGNPKWLLAFGKCFPS
jgi:putative sterol carrier protein